MMRITVSLILAAALPALAQKTELGFTAGAGNGGAEDVTGRAFATLGVEACGACSGGFSLFAEFSHWQHFGSGPIRRFELGAVGLRIQGKEGIRPFFDAGLAAGQDGFTRGTHNLVGLVLAGGAAIPAGERWYVRPQVRLYALSGIHFGLGISTGVGYRF